MADRFGENYIDQDDIGYAGAKIAVKRCDVLSEKANCFFFTCFTFLTYFKLYCNVFLFFDFFL